MDQSVLAILWTYVTSHETLVSTVAAILFGGVLSVLVAVWAENQRRPRLELSIENPSINFWSSGSSPQQFSALRVEVSNSPSSWLAWMRGPALQCRGDISFHRYQTGENIFGKVMAARWATSPQPTAIQIFDLQGNEAYRIRDLDRLVIQSRIDIYPGEKEIMDVVVRTDNDDDCYGWNNETYFVPPFGKNPNWKLGKDRFLVKVVVRSTGKTCGRVFQLINDTPLGAFRLEPATREESKRVH